MSYLVTTIMFGLWILIAVGVTGSTVQPTGFKVKIIGARAKNHHANYRPETAFDEKFSSFYCPRDRQAEGNYLNLTLEKRATISQVKIYSRWCCGYGRIAVTKIQVFNNTLKVGDCDSIIEKNKEGNDKDEEAYAYPMSCPYLTGDMVRLESHYEDDPTIGHCIREVELTAVMPGLIPDTCINNNIDFNGADMRREGGVATLAACVKKCQRQVGCKSVTFAEPEGGCWLKSKDRGDRVVHMSNRISVSMYCITGDTGPTPDPNTPEPTTPEPTTPEPTTPEPTPTPTREPRPTPDPVPGQGMKGEPGAPGPPGRLGDVGHPGENDICEMGPGACERVEGEIGESGGTGENGAPGLEGYAGDTGRPGGPGRDGAPGPPGDPGKKGEPGNWGDDGPDGESNCQATGRCKLGLGRCYATSTSRPSIKCKHGFAATSIWKNSDFFGLRCCEVITIDNEEI